MRLLKKILPAGAVAAALFLSGCGAATSTDPDLTPRTLTDANVMAEYCGTKATKVANLVKEGAEAKENAGKRKQLADWGLDPKNIDQIQKTKTELDARAQVPCGSDGKPAGLTAHQSFAADACLTADERKALKPEGSKTDDTLKATCQKVGVATYDTLSAANKQQAETKKYRETLGNANATLYDTAFATSYMKQVKVSQDANVPPSDTQAMANQIRAFFPNADAGDINVGSDAINHAAHIIDKGGSGFLDAADRYLKTKEDIAAFLGNSQDPKAVLARDHVLAAAIKAGGEDERARVMSGEGFIPIQLKDASQILGTSYVKDGQVKIIDQWRQSQPGDIYWLYFTYDDGKRMLVPEATLRGDCANVNGVQIRIVKADTPPAVGVAHGPGEEVCPAGTVAQPNGECHLPPKKTTPVCTTNCGPPPCTTNCGNAGCEVNCDLEAKDPAKQVQVQGNNRPGGGGQAPAQQDPVGPPAAGNPPATYQAPAPPAEPAYTAPPKVVPPAPAATPAPLPTVVPSEQPVNHGTVDPNPPAGEPCNSDFQSCP